MCQKCFYRFLYRYINYPYGSDANPYQHTKRYRVWRKGAKFEEIIWNLI